MTKRMIILSLALTACLWTGLSWADEGSAGAMPAMPCESDLDCEGFACVDGYCDYYDEFEPWVPECETDADCDSDTFCLWGVCESTEGYCQSDADCGPYQYCSDMGVDEVVVDSVDVPEESSTDSEEGGDAPTDPASEPVDDEDGSDTEIATPSWGACVVDLESVPLDPQCESLCEAMMACEDSGTSVSDPVEVDGPIPDDGSGSSGDAPPADGGDEDDPDGGEDSDSSATDSDDTDDIDTPFEMRTNHL